MIRGLLAVLALGMTFPVSALQLGAMQLESYLAQPLLVRIPIIVDEGGAVPDPSQFRARVLPADAYVQHGLEPPVFGLADLKARVSHVESGGYWLTIKSGRVFGEPAATLLIEVSDGRQTIVRQIDLMLDPEQLADERQQPAAAVPEQAAASPPEAAAAPVADSGPGTQSYGPVLRGETLADVAERVRPNASISTARMMDALRQANPAVAGLAAQGELPFGIILRVPKLAPDAAPVRPRLVEANQPITRPEPTARPQPARRVAPAPPPLPASRGGKEPLALATDFESYKQVRKPDEALRELDKREPDRYRADWTLDSLHERQAEVEDQAAAATEEMPAGAEDSDQAGAPETGETQDPLQALEQLRTFIETSEPETQDGGPGEEPPAGEAAVHEPDAGVIVAEPLAEESAPQVEEAAREQPSNGGWLLTLMLIFGGVAAWAAWPRFGPQLVDQWRARQVPVTVGPTPADSGDEAAPEDSAHDEGESTPAHLRALIEAAQRSDDEEVRRQATVAEIMAMRGHFDDAESVLLAALSKGAAADAAVATEAEGLADELPAEGVAETADEDLTADEYAHTLMLREAVAAPLPSDDDRFGETVVMDSSPEPDDAMDDELPAFELDGGSGLAAELADAQPEVAALGGDEDTIELVPEPAGGDEPIELEMSLPYADVVDAATGDELELDEPIELDLDLQDLTLEEPVDFELSGPANGADEPPTEGEAAGGGGREDPEALREILKELKRGARHDEQRQKLREAEAMIDDGQLGAAARLLDFLRNA